MSTHSDNEFDEPVSDEDATKEGGIMSRLVDKARGSGVGTEDPNIVGDVDPDVPPGRDPEAVVAEGPDTAQA